MKWASTPRVQRRRFLLYTSHMRNSTIPAASIVGFAILISGLLSFFAPQYAKAVGAECHTATQAEVDAGALPGRPVCPADTKAGFTNDAGQAKEYLNSLPNKCVGACQAPPDKAHIDKLNNTFAICAAGFFKAYTQQYGPVSISSAYRDGPSGENARAGGVPGSNHTRGVAIDVNPAGGRSSYQTMWAFAKSNPQFGVCFPHEGGDRPHMVLGGIGGNEGGSCASKGVSKPCNGLPFTPTNPGPDTSSLQSQISNAVRQTLGMQQPPMPPQPQLPPQPMLPAQPTLPAQPPISSQTNTPVQPSITTQYPQINPISSFINTNTNTNTNTKGTSTAASTSTFDLIDQFTGPDLVSSSIDIGKAVYIDLNASTSDALFLGAKKASSTAVNATGTLATNQSLSVPQTFTSNDLGNNPTVGFSGGQNTFVWQILENMKKTLLLALSYLKPFGGYNPNQIQAE